MTINTESCGLNWWSVKAEDINAVTNKCRPERQAQ